MGGVQEKRWALQHSMYPAPVGGVREAKSRPLLEGLCLQASGRPGVG